MGEGIAGDEDGKVNEARDAGQHKVAGIPNHKNTDLCQMRSTETVAAAGAVTFCERLIYEIIQVYVHIYLINYGQRYILFAEVNKYGSVDRLYR